MKKMIPVPFELSKITDHPAAPPFDACHFAVLDRSFFFVSPSELPAHVLPGNERILLVLAPKDRRKEAAEQLLRFCGLDGACIHYSSSGKPYLKDPRFSLSISHKKDLFAMALSSRSIGIDLEILRNRPFDPLAERFFSLREKAYYQKAPRKDMAFYEIWTQKEALSKLIGSGISESFPQLCTCSLPYDYVILSFPGGILLTLCREKDCGFSRF